jgi:hypothetical protein
MDDVDLTSERSERESAALIAAARAQATGPIIYYSSCRQCDEVLPEARREAGGFCSPECRDDFQKFEAALQRTGHARSA